jgi:hypothetical protein
MGGAVKSAATVVARGSGSNLGVVSVGGWKPTRGDLGPVLGQTLGPRIAKTSKSARMSKDMEGAPNRYGR